MNTLLKKESCSFCCERPVFLATCLQAVNVFSAVLLTGFTCIKYSNRHEKLSCAPLPACLHAKTFVEHVAWFFVMCARTLALSLLLAKAPEPTHVLALFFGISLLMEFRKEHSIVPRPARTPTRIAATIARAVVALFFKLRDDDRPNGMKHYVVFLIVQLTQSLGCIFLPFLQKYGFDMTTAKFNAFYFGTFGFCICAHYVLFVVGVVSLVIWFKMEKSMSPTYRTL